MKKIAFSRRTMTFAVLLMAATIQLPADPPASIVVRGTLTDTAGQPATLPGTRAYRIRYFNASSAGSQIGSDITGTLEIPADGRFSIVVTPPAGIYSAPEVYYELAIDSNTPTNGLDANDVFGSRTKVHSVPFAVQSVEATTSGSGTGSLNDAYNAGSTIFANSGPVIIDGTDGLVVGGPVATGPLTADGELYADTLNTVDDFSSAGATGGQAKSLNVVDGANDLVGYVAYDANNLIKAQIRTSTSESGIVELFGASENLAVQISGLKNGQPSIETLGPGEKLQTKLAGRADASGAPLYQMYNGLNKEIIRIGHSNTASGNGHGIIGAYQNDGDPGVQISGNINGTNGGAMSLYDDDANQMMTLSGVDGSIYTVGQIISDLTGYTSGLTAVGTQFDMAKAWAIAQTDPVDGTQVGFIANDTADVLKAQMFVDGAGSGQLALFRDNGDPGIVMSGETDGHASLDTYGPNGLQVSVQPRIADGGGAVNMRMYNEANDEVVRLGNGPVANGDGGGYLALFDTNGAANVTINGGNTVAPGGNIGLRDSAGNFTYIVEGDTGFADAIAHVCNDANGDLAAGISIDGEAVALFYGAYPTAASTTPTAGIDGSNGEVFGTTKNFLVEDPTNASRMIKHTSLEGPEAGIYFRGTGELVNGQATLTFPDYFVALADPNSVTVQLTPAARFSKGLATEDITGTNCTVVELWTGNGNYKFDYVVQANRKGFENYQVYQAKDEVAKKFGEKRVLKSSGGKKHIRGAAFSEAPAGAGASGKSAVSTPFNTTSSVSKKEANLE